MVATVSTRLYNSVTGVEIGPFNIHFLSMYTFSYCWKNPKLIEYILMNRQV